MTRKRSGCRHTLPPQPHPHRDHHHHPRDPPSIVSGLRRRHPHQNPMRRLQPSTPHHRNPPPPPPPQFPLRLPPSTPLRPSPLLPPPQQFPSLRTRTSVSTREKSRSCPPSRSVSNELTTAHPLHHPQKKGSNELPNHHTIPHPHPPSPPSLPLSSTQCRQNTSWGRSTDGSKRTTNTSLSLDPAGCSQTTGGWGSHTPPSSCTYRTPPSPRPCGWGESPSAPPPMTGTVERSGLVPN